MTLINKLLSTNYPHFHFILTKKVLQLYIITAGIVYEKKIIRLSLLRCSHQIQQHTLKVWRQSATLRTDSILTKRYVIKSHVLSILPLSFSVLFWFSTTTEGRARLPVMRYFSSIPKKKLFFKWIREMIIDNHLRAGKYVWSMNVTENPYFCNSCNTILYQNNCRPSPNQTHRW